MFDSTETELLALTQQLLDAITSRDWDTYEKLCDTTLTCIEPESRGHRVDGLAFHRYYFSDTARHPTIATTISEPHVRLLGEVAVVCYTRLTQSTDAAGVPTTSVSNETRVWQRHAGAWRLVHFHRTSP